MYNRSRGPDLQWADNKATEAKDQGEAFGIRIGHGSQGSSQKAIEKKQPRWVCSSPLSLFLFLFPSQPSSLPSSFSAFSPGLERLWSTPCSGQSYPIPFASVFLTAALPRLFPFDQSFLLTRLRPTACDWTRFFFLAERRRHLTRAELKKAN